MGRRTSKGVSGLPGRGPSTCYLSRLLPKILTCHKPLASNIFSNHSSAVTQVRSGRVNNFAFMTKFCSAQHEFLESFDVSKFLTCLFVGVS